MIRLTTTAITGNFIQDIQTEQGTIQFNFLRKNTPWIDKYFILAMDRNLKPHWFSMVEGERKWVIVEGLQIPKWIRGLEDQLSEAIVTYNRMN
jgi:hypothetical protein